MPSDRTAVHAMLEKQTGYGKRIYYNPPESLKMQYPCIVYNLVNLGSRHADNGPYFRYDTYTVTHIYPKVADEALSRRLSDTRGFTFDRSFVSDNLHHDVFTLKIY